LASSLLEADISSAGPNPTAAALLFAASCVLMANVHPDVVAANSSSCSDSAAAQLDSMLDPRLSEALQGGKVLGADVDAEMMHDVVSILLQLDHKLLGLTVFRWCSPSFFMV
jgi:hypothetical protein